MTWQSFKIEFSARHGDKVKSKWRLGKTPAKTGKTFFLKKMLICPYSNSIFKKWSSLQIEFRPYWTNLFPICIKQGSELSF